MARPAKTTGEPRRQRRERGSITADEIVNGAYALAAEVSVEKLSMPALARRLDVGVTSIYWYFRSKEQLLEAMRDRALAQYEIALPFTGTGSWHERLRTHFMTMRDLFRDNPVLCDLLIMHTADYGPGTNRVTYQRLEAVITTMVDAGFTPEDALETYFTLSTHSRGFAMLQRRGTLDAAIATPRPPIDEQDSPHLSHLAAAGYSLDPVRDRTFELGLDALIDRAKQVLAATR
ncbi:TetR/AcrR family transcriptional regulator [Nocardia sp. BMG111209]|uniref:TetR/AcrR family transcriptional regulator n=1 Tax=Nocardia sp. BMG111209 TaxID=1160137 RepID=UPI00037973FA|nr:TetR family transcriptional regulator [Nocardia sp. BMG111209]